jgi:hypothetical protein
VGFRPAQHCDREDEEADAGEEQRDADDDPEQGDLLGQVRDVGRRRERGLGHSLRASHPCDRMRQVFLLVQGPATRESTDRWAGDAGFGSGLLRILAEDDPMLAHAGSGPLALG